MAWPDVRLLGDSAIVITFGDRIADETNDRVMALAASLRTHPIEGPIRDVVPAIASLTLHVDPCAREIERMMEALSRRAREILEHDAARVSGTLHEIPVRYGGDNGPDLNDVADFGGIEPAEVIERHAARVYRVLMLGFLPGFAYLGEVDPLIAVPRRPAPRQNVPAGSVGIAGAQTGVYPQASPGGWQLIGRTETRMFDTAAGSALLEPGDRVRFVPQRA